MGVCPLEPQIDVIFLGTSDAHGSGLPNTIISSSFVSAHRSHESVLQLCGKHHLQGVWGVLCPQWGARGAKPARSL
jgi:hypothetical protein